ncbi:D-aminoacylase [Diaminobutyricimonas sp. TR449]|uniref:N-acyl-D-amino-acid deacylase family protein n=1 Tax=Diaminobutyricimonas sp. TR449 TaxID=2708076 RepID=UPI0014242A85|nr:D-aminoacylase [Diaminobutyricimonas sp. TR449]
MWILGADVIDGHGGPRYRADVQVEGGTIVRIDRDDTVRRKLQPGDIHAPGRIVSPGFIDMHAHADLAVLRDDDHRAKLAQGVTTQVIGQDGIGYAPVDDAILPDIRRQIGAWNGALPDERFTWRTMPEYLAVLDEGVPTNVAVLVPQGNLRLLTVGAAARQASASELDRMRGILADGLDAGAVGMSSGLTYTPGMYADTDELVALTAVIAQRGGYWAPHTRGYGGGALTAYAEAIEIARRSGCALHLTHATMNFAPNRGRASELLALVDAALADGVDVTLDSYPYLAGATTLAALLPSWAASGGPSATLERLDDANVRERIRHDLEVLGSDGAHGEIVDWDLMQISGVSQAHLAWTVGLSVAQIAEQSGVDATTAALDLMRDDALATGILMHVGDEQNVREIMQHPAHCAGSDGITVGERPHPRAWGAFARFLGHYARDAAVLSLETMVQHLTATPARRLGLADRGVLREGAVADLVVFDPKTIRDTATYESPRSEPVGVDHVLIAGTPVMARGARLPGLAGRVLRR